MTWLYKISQKISSLVLVGIFFKVEASGLEHLKNAPRPLLMIGCHKFFLDSFSLGVAIPFRFKNVLPLRIMGEAFRFRHSWLNLINKLGLIKLTYLMCGVFPAIRGVGLEKSLEAPVKLIKEGQIVFVHPEGRVVLEDKIEQFKRGAAYLAQETNASIIPVAFKISKPKKWKRRRYQVRFGEVFKIPQGLSLEENANYMRKIVSNLYETL
ncbi:lysophospholipid acyltransferase family protein [Patescibacteria group bacterium]